jgi:hypothetical protein
MSQNEDMRPEYDIRGGVRGKYFEQYGRSVVEVKGEWVQPQLSESQGEHPMQATVWVGAGPIYVVAQPVTGEPARQ